MPAVLIVEDFAFRAEEHSSCAALGGIFEFRTVDAALAPHFR
jgi:hypothetical protein